MNILKCLIMKLDKGQPSTPIAVSRIRGNFMSNVLVYASVGFVVTVALLWGQVSKAVSAYNSAPISVSK